MKTDGTTGNPAFLAGKSAAAFAHKGGERYFKSLRDDSATGRIVRLARRADGSVPRVRDKAEHFCQLRPGTKHVLQWRAYLAAALLAASALSAPASADDEALYGPVAPPGSAFVRVFNATPQDGVQARVADQALREIPAYNTSDFVFLPAGQHTLTIGARSESVNLKADRFYTAVAVDKGIHLFDNDGKASRLKALIILFNLTDRPLSLRTAQGATVMDAVAPHQSSSRTVNAIKTQLAVFSGANKLADAKPVSLMRGKAFSLFVLPSGDQMMTVWAVTPPGDPQ